MPNFMVDHPGQLTSDHKGGLNTPSGRLLAPTVPPRDRSMRQLGAPELPLKVATAHANLSEDRRNLHLRLELRARISSPTLSLVLIEIVSL